MSTNTETRLRDTAGIAKKLTVKKNTLEIWRLQGKGPKFIKIGRLVRYDEADVDAWLEANTRKSTSSAPQA